MVVGFVMCVIFFFKQKTAYEMRISDWSSDVCSSDLRLRIRRMIDRYAVDAGQGGQHLGPEIFRKDRSAGPLVHEGVGGHGDDQEKIGRASCRERGCQYV